VTVLQRAENLTTGRRRRRCGPGSTGKYLLGLAWDDPGFDHTVLAEFRLRSPAPAWSSGTGRAAGTAGAEGLVKAGGKQRTDSTHVVAAVAALNRLELAGESVRAVLEALAAACPDG